MLAGTLGVPHTTEAQGLLVSGSVARVAEGGDTLPISGAWVVTHRITVSDGGPVDSISTDGAGRFQLPVATADSGSVYLVSHTHQGITYFSDAFRYDGSVSEMTAPLVVYDTSSTEPPIQLAQRHLMVRNPDADGSRTVIDLLVLRNYGEKTRVAPDSSQPVWYGLLPEDALGLQVGESDVGADAVFRSGDTLVVVAPVPPGEKQILVSYLLPSRRDRLDLTLGADVDRLNLLFEDLGAQPLVPELTFIGVEDLETEQLARFEGEGLLAGTRVSVRFSESTSSVEDYWWVIVLVTGGVFLGGLIWWFTRTPAGAAPSPSPDVLAAKIAELDAWFEGLAKDAADRERAAYQRNRAELKSELEAALAPAQRQQ